VVGTGRKFSRMPGVKRAYSLTTRRGGGAAVKSVQPSPVGVAVCADEMDVLKSNIQHNRTRRMGSFLIGDEQFSTHTTTGCAYVPGGWATLRRRCSPLQIWGRSARRRVCRVVCARQILSHDGRHGCRQRRQNHNNRYPIGAGCGRHCRR